MKTIREVIKSQWKKLLLFWMLNLSITIIALVIPLVEAEMLDALVYTRSVLVFKRCILILAVFLTVQIVIRYFVNRIDSISTSRFALDFNHKILEHLFQSETKEVLAYEATYLHSRNLQDTDRLIKFYFSSISSVINNVVILVFAAIVLSQVNKYILLSIFLFLPIYTVIFLTFKERIRRVTLEQSEASNACFSSRNSIYTNYIGIKAKEGEDSAKRYLRKKEDTLLRNIAKTFRLKFCLYTNQLGVNSFFRFGGFILGGFAVMDGKISMGVFTYMLQYFTMLLNTVEQFLNIGTSYQEYKASAGRLNKIMEIKEENEGAGELEEVTNIELKEINYRFDEEGKWLYHQSVSYIFNPYKIYNIVGENGKGKTTLLLLMLGLYRDGNFEGEVYFNGMAMHELNMKLLRKENMSFMLQNSISFDGTVREYVYSYLSEQECSKALEDEDYIGVFANNYFNITAIFDKEFSKVSGGEKQLINLFVCLARNGSVFLLDEPTSNVFPGLKEKILILLKQKASSGNIVIVVTHDKDIMSNSIICDLGK